VTHAIHEASFGLDRLSQLCVALAQFTCPQRDFGLDENSAYLAMQRESRRRRKSMREIAEAILLNDDLRKNRWSFAAQTNEDESSSK